MGHRTAADRALCLATIAAGPYLRSHAHSAELLPLAVRGYEAEASRDTEAMSSIADDMARITARLRSEVSL